MPPEKSAYALARYSRSPDSIVQSLDWVRGHSSEKFLESFYFQYGHASIADLGHCIFCFEGISELALPSTVGLVTIEFHGLSFRTRPDGMVYRYRLEGYDAEWRTTRARTVEYEGLPRGDYTFEVVAIDRDLVRSAHPATLSLTIHFPYERAGLMAALGLDLL